MNAPKARLADLATPIAEALAPLGITPARAKPVKLVVKDGPNLKFRGSVIDRYGQNPERNRWEELLIYQLEDRSYVAARAWHSNVPGEESFWFADAVETVEQAMTVWGWTNTAKGYARTLGWDVARRIGPQ
jgi:hypothetical protein